MIALAVALAVALPASAGAQGMDPTIPVPMGPTCGVPGAAACAGPSYYSSANVQLVGRIPTVGDAVGAKVVGNFLYVTSSKSLNIFDITNPEAPVSVAVSQLEVEWENEEVPTNGKLLGISSSNCCLVGVAPLCAGDPTFAKRCLALYDVSKRGTITRLKSVAGAGDHTAACLLDCTWFYGSSGSIVDARDPKNAATVPGDGWISALPQGTLRSGSCHHQREITPGYVLGSCPPPILVSVRPEDGGSPVKPVLIAKGNTGHTTLVHSSRWPREGRDKFILVGEETNFRQTCDDTVGGFMTMDATPVLAKDGYNRGTEFNRIDWTRPKNGNYLDGWGPHNGLGCSMHWFQEHPTFRNGGLVAVSAYEQGTRLYQITPAGKIIQQGFFLPVGGATSAPHWAPNGKVIYNIDYERGIDILRYTGDTYVPTDTGAVIPTPGATPGTQGDLRPPQGSTSGPGAGSGSGSQAGGGAAPTACASAAGFNSALAKPKGGRVSFVVSKRQDRAFDVQVFQQSSGRSVVNNRLLAAFKGKKRSFEWNGRDRKGRKLRDGFYFVRFTMRLDGKVRDVRRATLERRHGKFRRAPAFYQRVDCGEFQSLKLFSSVFGGKRNKALGISYRLVRGARKVTIDARVGKKLVKRINGGVARSRTFRYALPARLVPRGRRVRIRVTLDTGLAKVTRVLSAKRV